MLNRCFGQFPEAKRSGAVGKRRLAWCPFPRIFFPPPFFTPFVTQVDISRMPLPHRSVRGHGWLKGVRRQISHQRFLARVRLRRNSAVIFWRGARQRILDVDNRDRGRFSKHSSAGRKLCMGVSQKAPKGKAHSLGLGRAWS